MSNGVPCSGQIQFWTVVRHSMREQAKQLKRIADALDGTSKRPFRPGDKVLWDDPDGGITRGWEVVNVPEPDDEGKVPEDGVYSIYNAGTKSAAEVHACELILDCPGGAR